MIKTCQQCNNQFEIRDEDLKFYDKVSPVFGGKKYQIPSPALCIDCRRQQRLCFRNERFLYTRKCDLSGEEIISLYAPNKPYKVYERELWWSDKWNPLEYGKEFEFTRPFFEQYKELLEAVPRMSIMVTTCENCGYAPYSMNSKNCYMSVSIVGSEDIYYSYQANASKNCIDCTLCTKCELCYDDLYCVQCYNTFYSQYCQNSRDLLFCQECFHCENCIGCKNLTNKSYHILNKPATKEEYHALVDKLQSYSFRQLYKREVEKFFAPYPWRSNHNIACENVVGDNLQHCKNAYYCFDAVDLEDCAYVFTCPQATKDTQDTEYTPRAELVFSSVSPVDSYMSAFNIHSWNVKNCYYCNECYNSHHLFGCVALRNKEYCVFNKQYKREEYEKLVPKIIESMRRLSGYTGQAYEKNGLPGEARSETESGDWGKFFPPSLSPFGYNETIANEHYPLTKEEALSKGFNWSDYEPPPPKVDKILTADQMKKLPDNIKDIPDDILNWALTCEVTGKPYRIIKQELQFYRDHNIPIPRQHPDQRHTERMILRNPRKLYKRVCMKCGKNIETTITKDRPEIVYCEECYSKEVY